MRLRTITLHIKNQNWFGVVLDFLIVVVGIFVGLQVSNWNESRKDAELSTSLTERLREDLREEAWNYQYLIEYYDDVKASLIKAIHHIDGTAQLSNEQFLIAAYRATQYNIDYRIRATFDELQSNGDLALIKDDELLKTAIHVYNFELFKTLRSNGQNAKYRELFRMSVPIDVQKHLLEQCGDKLVDTFDYHQIVDSLDYPCNLTIPEPEINAAVDMLTKEQQLIGFLRLRYSQINSNISSLTAYFPEVREGLKRLREPLN